MIAKPKPHSPAVQAQLDLAGAAHGSWTWVVSVDDGTRIVGWRCSACKRSNPTKIEVCACGARRPTCHCGSGKEVMSTGRCMSCAGRLAAKTRARWAKNPPPVYGVWIGGKTETWSCTGKGARCGAHPAELEQCNATGQHRPLVCSEHPDRPAYSTGRCDWCARSLANRNRVPKPPLEPRPEATPKVQEEAPAAPAVVADEQELGSSRERPWPMGMALTDELLRDRLGDGSRLYLLVPSAPVLGACLRHDLGPERIEGLDLGACWDDVRVYGRSIPKGWRVVCWIHGEPTDEVCQGGTTLWMEGITALEDCGCEMAGVTEEAIRKATEQPERTADIYLEAAALLLQGEAHLARENGGDEGQRMGAELDRIAASLDTLRLSPTVEAGVVVALDRVLSDPLGRRILEGLAG